MFEGLEWAVWVISSLMGVLGVVWGMTRNQSKHIKGQYEDSLEKMERALEKMEKERNEYRDKLFMFYDNVTPILKDVQMTLSRFVKLFEGGKGI